MADMEQIQSLLDAANKVDVLLLKREGKDFSFIDVYRQIEEIFLSIQTLQNHKDFWDYLTEEKRNNFKSNLTRFLDAVKRIEDFNPSMMGNPQEERNKIATQIKDSYNNLFEHWFPRLKLFVLEKEFSSKKVESLVVQAQSDLDAIAQQKQQGEDILKAMQDASASTGVSAFAGVFGKQADTHDASAKVWLGVTVFAALGIVGFLYWIFNELVASIQADVQIAVTLQVFFAKILLLSFFSVIFYQIVKNYNANMHLATLNRHRENSLKSFRSFVESTDNPSIKDVVLIQATKAIFEAGDTGYISNKGESVTSMDTIKIVEQANSK